MLLMHNILEDSHLEKCSSYYNECCSMWKLNMEKDTYILQSCFKLRDKVVILLMRALKPKPPYLGDSSLLIEINFNAIGTHQS